jgi:hypothetical protein
MSEEKKGIHWYAIIVEQGELSMGRVMTWVVFGVCLYFWFTTQPLPTTLFDTLLVLFAYNFGKKFTGPFAEMLKGRLSKKGSAPLSSPSAPLQIPMEVTTMEPDTVTIEHTLPRHEPTFLEVEDNTETPSYPPLADEALSKRSKLRERLRESLNSHPPVTTLGNPYGDDSEVYGD